MWAGKSSPNSNWNSLTPDFSAGIVSESPRFLDSSGIVPPNCSSTSTPAVLGSRPAATAFSTPS